MLPPSKAQRLLERYFGLLLLIAIAALIAMMLTTVADVFMRYVFNAPVRGSYDIVEISLLISVYFALPTVIFEGQAILIDLIDGMIPPRLLKALKMIAALTAVAMLALLFWSMLKPAGEAYSYGDIKLELDLPTWIIWSFALFGLANSILAGLAAVLKIQRDTNDHILAEYPE
ncbi:MAG: TRAP transporter small permease [Allorhizobium sp.]